MKRILAVAHSYYMLLTLIQMKATVLKKESVDLLLSDVSANSLEVYKNLLKQSIFENCYYYKTAELGWKIQDKKGEKGRKFLRGICKPQEAVKVVGLESMDFSYDVLLVYAANHFDEQVIFNVIKRRNIHACCHLYEEGYTSYYSPYGVFSLSKKLSYIHYLSVLMTIFGKKKQLISNNIRAAWYFNPRLIQYTAEFEVKAIPPFDSMDQSLRNKMNRVFGYSDDIGISKDIIFLEGCLYTDGLPTDDLDLLNHVAEKLEKNNIAVKLHPRTKDNRFIQVGYETNAINIPLELLVLNGKRSGKTFIAMESGAPLACLMNFKNDNRVILLYKCSQYSNKQTEDVRFENMLQEIIGNTKPGQLMVPANLSELDIILEHLK